MEQPNTKEMFFQIELKVDELTGKKSVLSSSFSSLRVTSCELIRTFGNDVNQDLCDIIRSRQITRGPRTLPCQERAN